MRVFLVLLLLLPLAYGQRFDSYGIDVDIGETVTETVRIELTNDIQLPLDSVSFILPKSPKIISVDGGNYEAAETERGLEVRLIPSERITPGESATMSIEFEANNLITKGGDSEIFKLNFVASSDIADFSVSVTLPKGGSLVLDNEKPIASPPPQISTNGERIMLKWNQQLKKGDAFSSIALFKRPEKSSYGFLIVLMPFAAIGLVLYYRKKTVKIVETSLEEDEKKIFDYIKERGEITQEEVIKITGFSKSKVSKLVRRLEERKFIEKEPYKKTNKLRLAKNISS